MSAPPPPTPSQSAPQRCIFQPSHLTLFQSSPTYSTLLSTVERITQSLTSFPNPPPTEIPIVDRLCLVLKKLQDSVTDFPAESKRGRFGSPQFKVWHKTLSSNIGNYLSYILNDTPINKVIECPTSMLELRSHILISFGHPMRIDYGTGHELSFLIFLTLLLPSLLPSQLSYSISKIWKEYINTTIKIQREYNLEPAGSHGVWGLDDYYCLGYLFGAARLDGEGEN